MKKEEIVQNIEKILDEWDPIGILQDIKPITYPKDSIGEYSQYIKPILKIYLANQSIYDFLVKLQTDLFDYPNNEMKQEIKLVSERIINFLVKCKTVDIQECQ